MLLPDEYVVHIARLHWVVYVNSLAILVFGVLLLHYGKLPAEMYLDSQIAAYVDTPIKIISLFCIAVGTLYVFFISMRYVSTEIVVTSQRVIYKRGLIAPVIAEAVITKISSVDIDQSVAGRLLDYGTVTVRSSGQDIKPVEDISDPFSFYYHVMRSARLEMHPEEKAAAKPAAAIERKGVSRPIERIPEYPGSYHNLTYNEKSGESDEDEDEN